jgi:hypothetical protein
MTAAQTSPAQNWGQVCRTRTHRRGAYGAAPEASPGRTAKSPVPGWFSGIAARPKVAPDRLAERTVA